MATSGKLGAAVVGAGALALMAVAALGIAVGVVAGLGRAQVQEAVGEVERAEATLRLALDELTELAPAVVLRTRGAAADVAALAELTRREQRLPEKQAQAARLQAALAEVVSAGGDDDVARKLGLLNRRIALEQAAVAEAAAAVEVAAGSGAGRVADALGVAR